MQENRTKQAITLLVMTSRPCGRILAVTTLMDGGLHTGLREHTA